MLTTNHPASHYGIPVLVDLDGATYGPADIVQEPPEILALFSDRWTGADYVASEITYAYRAYTIPPEMREACRLYCSQWPEGPQVA